MSNMSYCRFENTASDLADCFDHMYDDLEGSEQEARARIIRMAHDIAEEHPND